MRNIFSRKFRTLPLDLGNKFDVNLITQVFWIDHKCCIMSNWYYVADFNWSSISKVKVQIPKYYKKPSQFTEKTKKHIKVFDRYLSLGELLAYSINGIYEQLPTVQEILCSVPNGYSFYWLCYKICECCTGDSGEWAHCFTPAPTRGPPSWSWCKTPNSNIVLELSVLHQLHNNK